MKGDYLNKTDLGCYSWDEGWESCKYPDVHYCYEWNSIYLMPTEGNWVYWDNVPGYRINDFGSWKEIWGDSLDLGEHEWDDGNTLDGDGWSRDCKVETGYT